MICQRCGTKYDDNAAACPVCSQPNSPVVQQTEAPPQYSYEAPPQYNYEAPPQYSYEAPQKNNKASAPAEPTYYNYGEEFSGTKYNKRKRRKKTASVVVSISVAVVLAAVFLLNFNLIVGFCLKTFASPDTYFGYVEARAGTQAAMLSAYGDFKKNSLTDVATEGKISLNLGEKAKEAIGANDYSWLEDFYISTSAVANGNLNKTELKTYAGDTMLLGVETYVDGESGDIILGLPGLTDKFVSGVITNNSLTTKEISELLPSEKEMKDISSRYIKIVKKHSSGVRRATEDFVVDGVEQKLSMLELNFGRADMIELLKDLATELKNDEQVLCIFDDITIKAKENGALEKDDDLRLDLIKEIDEFLQKLENARTDVEIEIPTLRYRNFVTMNHNIVGKEITVNDKNVLYFLNVEDGKEIGSEIRIGKAATLIGYGTKEDGKTSVEYAITNNGAQLGRLYVNDLAFDKKEKNISGNIKFLPTPRFIYELELPTELGKMGAGLDLSFDFGYEGSNFTVNLLSDEKLYFGITAYSTVTETEEIAVPKEKVFNGKNEMEAFFKSLDFKALEEKMQKAELPKEIIQLTQYLQLIQELSSQGKEL